MVGYRVAVGASGATLPSPCVSTAFITKTVSCIAVLRSSVLRLLGLRQLWRCRGVCRCGTPQHGLSSNTMALITSDCVPFRVFRSWADKALGELPNVLVVAGLKAADDQEVSQRSPSSKI